MKKRFLKTVALVLVLDVGWGLISTAVLVLVAQLCAGPLLFSFSVVVPFLVIGLLVTVAGWVRVRSAKTGLVIALGALVGTVVAVGIAAPLLDVGIGIQGYAELREVPRVCAILWRWSWPGDTPF